MKPKCPDCNIELMAFGPMTDHPLREGPYTLHWEWIGRCFNCGKAYQYNVTYRAAEIEDFQKVGEE